MGSGPTWKNHQVQIGMLGTFEVRTDDGVVADVPGARLRALLIALALEPGRVVPKATLIDWIWDEFPPADAANALQRLVSRLRKALPDGVVEGQNGGYRLMVEPDAVDAVRFERLVGQARNAEDPQRVRLLREGAPDLMKAFGAFATAATTSKAIDTKTKELMALAIGIAIHCDGCVAFHTKMAHQHGATREEVAETVALALYMGGGPAAVYGGDALRAYDQFTSTKT